MTKSTGLRLRYLVYVLIVVLWTLVEWMTGGRYRVWFIMFGASLGFGIGLGTETFRANEEVLSFKQISLSALYAVPLGFCDSLLLFVNSFKINSFILLLISIYMILSQILIIVFLVSMRECAIWRSTNGKGVD